MTHRIRAVSLYLNLYSYEPYRLLKVKFRQKFTCVKYNVLRLTEFNFDRTVLNEAYDTKELTFTKYIKMLLKNVDLSGKNSCQSCLSIKTSCWVV